MKVIAALSLAAIAALTPTPSLKSEITKSQNMVTKYMKAKDLGKLEKVLREGTTADFKYVEGGKEEGFDDMWMSMKMGLDGMTKITECTTRVTDVKMEGDMGWCKDHHHMMGMMMGQDKKKHKMSFDGVSADTFMKVDGKWKMSRMEWVSQTIKMDGKKVDPAQMMGGGN